MARTATSREASVIAYFRTAPLEVANAVFGIVRSTLKEREGGASGAQKAPQRGRKPRAEKPRAKAVRRAGRKPRRKVVEAPVVANAAGVAGAVEESGVVVG